MKNKNITTKITQGMYVLTTNNGGCIVDAVSQVSSSDNPLIAVSVMKRNYTNILLKENDKFALSVLSKNVNPKIIETFGMNSTRDIDKFENILTTEVDNIKIINDTIGYMLCEIVDRIENETHTLFIGRIIKEEIFNDEYPMSYAYYQEHKNELIKTTTKKGKTAWVCSICGYIYYGEEIPDNFKCPICGVEKKLFKKDN